MRRTVLKASRAREVRVETDADGRTRVVKRFASPGRLAALFDRRRAERELELLAYLHAEGVPVPRPLGVERRAGGWEVASEHLADRCDLGSLLAEGRVASLAAFRALGSALGRLAELGVDHPDLHPGNVLVGAHGEIALIDFHAARRGQRASSERLARDVIAFEAALRERTPVAERRALLLAWLGGAERGRAESEPSRPASLRSTAPDGGRRRARRDALALAECLAARCAMSGSFELDRLARARRVAVVAERGRRWRRGGNAVLEVEHAGRRALVRRDVEAELHAELLALLAGGAESVALAARRFVAVRGRAREIEAAWLAAAELDEHAVGVARPAAWLGGRTSAAAFELPGDARCLAPDARHLGDDARARGALAELVGALCDRGIWLPDLPGHALWLDANDRALVVAPRALEPWPTRRGWLARSGLTLARTEFARGLRASDRGHAPEHVERELARA